MADPQVSESDPAKDLLAPLKVPNSVKALAWDVYHRNDDPDTFTKRIGSLPIDKAVKAQLWDLKFAKPEQPKEVSLTVSGKPSGQVLGDPTKKAELKPPETLGSYAKRQVEAVGKTLYESLPFLTASAGGALAGAAAIPTGPIGAATAGVLGAGAGGGAGRIVQQYIDYLLGKSEAPSVAKVAGEAGKEATSQMVQQMGGEVIAAPLGLLRRGGFLAGSRETMDTLRESRALGANLSGPEMASGTMAGDIGKKIQRYGSGSFAGESIQRKAREKGTAGVTQVIDHSLALLGHPGMTGGPTETSKGSAYAARRFVGELLDSAADQAPPINVKAVKDLAAKELEAGIAQHLKAVPDVANPKLAQIIREVRNRPELIQKLPRPVLTQLADVILEKHKSPSLSILRRVMGMEDETPAKAVWKEVQALDHLGKPLDELYSKNDTQRVATQFKGQLREVLGKGAGKEFTEALGHYRDLVNGDYLRSDVILGTNPLPKNEEEANTILTSMGDRLRKAVESGEIARRFDTPNGQQVVRNISRVANLMDKRAPQSGGFIRQIFEISRMVGAGVAAASAFARGGLPSPGATTVAIAWEALPDYFTWLVHNPEATKWFIEGSKAKNPTISAAAAVRLAELYRRDHAKPPKKDEESE